MRFGKALLLGALIVAAVGCSQSQPYAPPPSPASPQMQASARAAAVHFSSVTLSRRFAASWDLLAPAAKQHIPKNTWVKVHDGCQGAAAGSTGVIKSVTVFGNAAIVTEAIAGATPRSPTIEAVFNYSNSHWGYSPSDLSIYQHGSISADIAAAKTAGYCAGQNKPLL